MIWIDGAFEMYYYFRSTAIARCTFDETIYDNSTWDVMKYLPQNCTDWKTQYGFAYPNLKADPTFTLEIGKKCNYTCSPTQDAPNSICMSESSTIHGMCSLLYG